MPPEPPAQRFHLPSAEYNLTEHCNLRCACCDHSSPLLPRKFASLESFRRDIERLATALRVGELKLLGGEPLLHPEVETFARTARDSGLAETVALFTNGTLLHRATPGLLDLVDRLFVSVYPATRLGLPLEAVEELSRRHRFRLEVRRFETFRLTTINTEIRDPELVARIYRECGMAHRWGCHTIHEGRLFRCSVAPFLEGRLAMRGVRVSTREVDGVRIHDNPKLRRDLEAYFAREEPLAACSWCLGSSGVELPHRQLDRRGVEEAIAAEHPRPRDLLAPQGG